MYSWASFIIPTYYNTYNETYGFQANMMFKQWSDGMQGYWPPYSEGSYSECGSVMDLSLDAVLLQFNLAYFRRQDNVFWDDELGDAGYKYQDIRCSFYPGILNLDETCLLELSNRNSQTGNNNNNNDNRNRKKKRTNPSYEAKQKGDLSEFRRFLR